MKGFTHSPQSKSCSVRFVRSLVLSRGGQDCGVDGPQSGPLSDVVIEPARRAVTHQTIVSSEVSFSVPLSARREWRSGG